MMFSYERHLVVVLVLAVLVVIAVAAFRRPCWSRSLSDLDLCA